MTGKKHETHIRVRGYEMDSYGHVNNAVYLQYLEQARWEFMKEISLLDDINAGNLMLVVIEVNIKYQRETVLFEDLVVETSCVAENPFLIFRQRIIKKDSGLAAARAKVKTIFLDAQRAPVEIPSFVEGKI